MAFTLEVEFTGLCALVHDRAAENLRVLFLDATSPSPEQMSAKMRKHLPTMIVNIEDIGRKNNFNSVGGAFLGENGGLYRRYELPKANFGFQPQGSFALGVNRDSYDNLYHNRTEYPARFQERDYYWIAALGRLGSQYAEIDSRNLESNEKVHTTLEIRSGAVSCSAIAKQRFFANTPFIRWQFGVDPDDPDTYSNHVQAMCSKVILELSVQESFIELVAGETYFTISPPRHKERVKVLLGNIDADLDAALEDSDDRLFDFRWFYELLTAPPSPSNRPLPFYQPERPAVSGVYCPLASLEPPM